jgi:hypothetical protein
MNPRFVSNCHGQDLRFIPLDGQVASGRAMATCSACKQPCTVVPGQHVSEISVPADLLAEAAGLVSALMERFREERALPGYPFLAFSEPDFAEYNRLASLEGRLREAASGHAE